MLIEANLSSGLGTHMEKRTDTRKLSIDLYTLRHIPFP